MFLKCTPGICECAGHAWCDVCVGPALHATMAAISYRQRLSDPHGAVAASLYGSLQLCYHERGLSLDLRLICSLVKKAKN